MNRYAIVRNGETEARVAQYLPSNYNIIGRVADDVFVIGGDDMGGGWGLDNYIIPRLASGMIFATEITADEWQWERNGGVTLYGGAPVRVQVTATNKMMFVSFDDHDAVINGISMTFRMWMKYNEARGGSWFVEHSNGQRTDRGAMREPLTKGQASKLYSFIGMSAASVPARVILAGQVAGIESEIGSEERSIGRLKEQIADHEKTIYNLRIHLESGLGQKVSN